MFDNLKTDESINNEKDSLGGFQILPSNLYDMMITKAFMSESSGEAMAVNIHAKSAEGKMLQQQLWVTSGKKKGKKNYYVNKKSGEKHYLPGFNVANAICLLSIGKELADVETKPGLEDLFGESTKVQIIEELVGKPITMGVIEMLVDVTAKDADSGDYLPTGKSKGENDIDKVFRTKDKLTVVEIRAGLEEPKFMEQWLEKWKGEVKDRTTDTSGAAEGVPERKTGDAAEKTDLFK